MPPFADLPAGPDILPLPIPLVPEQRLDVRFETPHSEYGIPATTSAPLPVARIQPEPEPHSEYGIPEVIVPFIEVPAGPEILPLLLPELPIVPEVRTGPYPAKIEPEVRFEPEVPHAEYGIPEVITTTTEVIVPFVEVPAGPEALPLPLPELPIVEEVRFGPYPARIEPEIITTTELPILRDIPVGPYPARIEPEPVVRIGKYPARVESHYH